MNTPSVIDWSTLDETARAACLARPQLRDAGELEAGCRAILDAVRKRGDAALAEYTQKFDGTVVETLRVTDAALKDAWDALTSAQQDAFRTARDNLVRYHRAQLTQDTQVDIGPGIVCESLQRAIEQVGIYVPGGSAPLPSSLLMAAVPARLAGCKRLSVCSPPGRDGKIDPLILAAASLCEVDEVYAVGGAQAIAALAFGTDTIASVDKICGPGSAWVTEAKKQVSVAPDGAAIDMPAGPSEVLVIADANADTTAVAWDLLAQAEHGADSQVLLVTDSQALATRVAVRLPQLLETSARGDVLAKALAHCRLIVVPTLGAAVSLSNDYAPEHLVLNVTAPRELLRGVQNAGSVFLGAHAPVTLGDYCSGTNHVLPTAGHARARGGLSVADFVKRISVQNLTADGLAALAPTACTLAELEGLHAHAAAVRCRLPDAERTVA